MSVPEDQKPKGAMLESCWKRGKIGMWTNVIKFEDDEKGKRLGRDARVER